MKYVITMAFLCLSLSLSFSQDKIKDGTILSINTPVPAALLELESNQRGLLPPRVALAGRFTWTLTGTPVDGMVVFNTNKHLPTQLDTGLVVWYGGRWMKLVNEEVWPYHSNDLTVGTPGNGQGIIGLPGSGLVASGFLSHAEGTDATAEAPYSQVYGEKLLIDKTSDFSKNEGRVNDIINSPNSWIFGAENTINGGITNIVIGGEN